MASKPDSSVRRSKAKEANSPHFLRTGKRQPVRGDENGDAFDPPPITIDSLLAIIYENKGGI